MPPAKLDKTYQPNDELCSYDCSNKAKYRFENGKYCCSEKYNQCPQVRTRNSSGLKKAYQEGRKNCDHFDDTRNWNKGKTRYDDDRIYGLYDPSLVFVENSPYNGKVPKAILLATGEKENRCEKCEIDEWNSEPITIEMDHINGIRNDHRKENLKFLCPNCHSQTPTYRGKKNTGRVKFSEIDIVIAVKKSKTINEVLTTVGMSQNSSNRPRIERIMTKYNLTFK